ncbi:MAG: amino acid ABC transporter substrate-binding protein [Desulfobacteraceae bacterium]|nr:amino acid ABC transporter substrate-binding protein [Desulfobacteraceae bacterium]
MITKFTHALIIAAVFELCLSAACPASDDKEPILIGATVSLEGNYSEPSSMVRNGFKLWERDVNQRGGILGRPVKLILYDDKSQKERVRKFYEKLIDEDKVDLVFSPYSTPLTLVASELTEKKKMVMLACAASGEKIWQRGYNYVFGVYALADRYFIGMMDLMAREGLETVAIVHEDSNFNNDVAAGAEKWAKRFGMQVSVKQSYTDAQSQLPQLIKHLINRKADGLAVSAYSPDCHRFLKLLASSDYRPRALGMTIAPVHPDFLQKAGPIGDGVFGPSQWEPDERIPFPGTMKFITDFVQFTQKRPSYHAGSAYAACRILEDAISRAGVIDHDRIRDYIRALDTVTVIGRFKVDELGKQIGHNPLTIQWQSGKKEIVYPTKLQTAPARFYPNGRGSN